jgi:hypothetical protein
MQLRVADADGNVPLTAAIWFLDGIPQTQHGPLFSFRPVRMTHRVRVEVIYYGKKLSDEKTVRTTRKLEP